MGRFLILPRTVRVSLARGKSEIGAERTIGVSWRTAGPRNVGRSRRPR